MNIADERWLRRGHERKPNAIVRSIYWVADWLGDFAPLMNTAKQGAINTGLVVANFIILVGILVTSAVHSLELLRYAGAKGGLEYVLLLVWESVFLISSFLLDQALKRGMGNLKQSWQVWIPFLLGLTFVFASNLMGMAGNLAGMLLGGITPFLLLFIKWMLGWQLYNRAEFDANKKQEKSRYPERKTQPNIQPEKLKNPEGNQPDIQPQNPENPAKNPTESPGEKPVQRGDQEKTSSKSKTKHAKASVKKKVAKKSDVNKDENHILEVAMRLKKEQGEFSRSELEKEANTTTHFARKVIAQLEKMEAENPDILIEKSSTEAPRNPAENPTIQPKKSNLHLVK